MLELSFAYESGDGGIPTTELGWRVEGFGYVAVDVGTQDDRAKAQDERIERRPYGAATASSEWCS